MGRQVPQTIYTVAHTDVRALPFNNAGRTLRVVIPCNMRASAVRVVFSGWYEESILPVGAASLCACDTGGTLLPDAEPVALTVGGRGAFELMPGRETESDTAAYTLTPGQPVALDIYYPAAQKVTSGNWVGVPALRSRPGNYCGAPRLPGPRLVNRLVRTLTAADLTIAVTSVARVVALCPEPGRVVACFGDSIMQQGNWTTPFEKRLHRRFAGKASLCNLGIGGNRLLRASPPNVGGQYGPAGIVRFEREVLSLPGITHAIVGLGSNDLGHPGTHGAPPDDLPTPAAYAAAMEGLAGRLRQSGIKALAAVIAPRVLQKPYTMPREVLRRRLNDWLMAAPCFDGVLDFDAVLRRDDGLPGMKEGCALPDGLHPSPYGGLLMAKSIDLLQFE